MIGYARRHGCSAMILQNDEVLNRLSSPDNLMNRLAVLREPDLAVFTGPVKIQESVTPELVDNPAVFSDANSPSVDDLIENVETKLKRSLAKEGALDVLVNTVTQLNQRLPEVNKPEALAKIAKEMQSVISGLSEGEGSKSKSGNQTQVVIWKPVTVQNIDYETVMAHDE